MCGRRAKKLRKFLKNLMRSGLGKSLEREFRGPRIGDLGLRPPLTATPRRRVYQHAKKAWRKHGSLAGIL